MPLPKNLANKIKGDPEPAPSAEIVPQAIMSSAGVRCRICAHPQRAEIERRWVTSTATGIAAWLTENGYPRVTAQYIKRHFDTCVVGELVLLEGKRRSAEAFIARIEALADRLEGYLDEFDNEDNAADGGKMPKDWRGLSSVVRELRGSLELLGKASGHIRPDIEINIVESPQFQAVVMPIVQVTAKCKNCGPIIDELLAEENT